MEGVLAEAEGGIGVAAKPLTFPPPHAGSFRLGSERPSGMGPSCSIRTRSWGPFFRYRNQATTSRVWNRVQRQLLFPSYCLI